MRGRPLLLLTATVASLVLSPAIRLDSPARSQVRKGEIPAPLKQKKYVNAQESAKIAEAFRKANKAFEKEDYKAGAESLLTAYAINPEDDLIINLMAEAYAMVGDRSALLMWLRRLLTVSPCFFHFPENAASVLSSKEYRDLALAAKAKQTRRHGSELAFMLSETDLIPEGIAYDPLDKVFFLSSLHKRKIVLCPPPDAPPPSDCGRLYLSRSGWTLQYAGNEGRRRAKDLVGVQFRGIVYEGVFRIGCR